MSRTVEQKYLADFAEPEVALLSSFPQVRFNNVLIIPAYKESFDFLTPYLEAKFTDLLVILVLNQPDTDNDRAIQSEFFQELSNATMTIWQERYLSLHPVRDNSAILCIQRFQDELRLHHKQGVGLARKIAADCALQLKQSGHIQSDWIASTDADASLPRDYFQRLNEEAAAGQTFEFQHEANQGPVSQATQRYELGLRYYQAGLEWAGSRYALHTLGSCLAVNAHAYASVRGFPKRAGGEDFYLLNKLLKIGKVIHRADVNILIQSRESDRVPFGTGPAINKILKLTHIDDYQYYDPRVFDELKRCLAAMEKLTPLASFEDWQAEFEPLHFEILTEFGLARIYQHQRHQNLDEQSLRHNLFIWFDGLLTLRFIHAIRDQKFPDISLLKALEKAPFSAT